MSTAAILVIYQQSLDEVTRCIENLRGLRGEFAAIYVVDNGPHRLPETLGYGEIILRPDENLGFCAGVNLGANVAHREGHETFLLLNTDTHDVDPSLLLSLQEVLITHPDAAFVSPGIRQWPNTELIWYAGGRIVRPLWVSRHPGINGPWPSVQGQAIRTGYFSGCCVLVDTAACIRVGGFDERLFMYYDEVDLATRVKRQLQRSSYVIPMPLLSHEKMGRSMNENEAFYHARNARIMLARYETPIGRLLGAIGQLVITPFQLRRCETPATKEAYRRGRRVSIADLI